MNEFASDEDSSEDHDEMAALAREDIVKSNISKRVSQIIVPLAAVSRQGEKSEDSGNGDGESESEFLAKVSLLQAEAREDLVSARENARIKLQDIINTRKKLRNRNLFNLLGLPLDTKVSLIIKKNIYIFTPLGQENFINFFPTPHHTHQPIKGSKTNPTTNDFNECRNRIIIRKDFQGLTLSTASLVFFYSCKMKNAFLRVSGVHQLHNFSIVAGWLGP